MRRSEDGMRAREDASGVPEDASGLAEDGVRRSEDGMRTREPHTICAMGEYTTSDHSTMNRTIALNFIRSAKAPPNQRWSDDGKH